ncbi:MAG: ATP-binding protein [Clostridium sp.]
MKNNIKPIAEERYKEELLALKFIDKGEKPQGWKLTPKSVRAFILGMKEEIDYKNKKIKIKKKFFGDDALVERAIITLAGNRALILVGEPGTAKTMLSELLSVAICGSTTNTIQGTAGTSEDTIKYSWNYALLLSKGPCEEALVQGPIYKGMVQGTLTRFEEITRCPSEVQDSLISILSDKILAIPELGENGVIKAKQGFNIIATANIKDRGVNEMSSALKRRFNFETISPIASIALEKEIIKTEATNALSTLGINIDIDENIVEVLSTIFHELRFGKSVEGMKINKPNGVMSTAEAVAVYCQCAMSAYYFGEKRITTDNLVQNLLGSIMKENKDDIDKVRVYFNTVIKTKGENLGGIYRELEESKKWIR